MPISANIPKCQYIRTDGRRCGSPALKTKRWCYFHYEVNRPTVTLDVPALEDGNAVQLALTDLARAVADDRIPLKNAALLAYILQTASANLKRVQLGVFTDHMITDLPELDPYSRGLSISDPSQSDTSSAPAPEGRSRIARGVSPGTGGDEKVPSALPKARVSEGHGSVGQGFSPDSRSDRAKTTGAPAPSSPPKAGAQPAGEAPVKAPSAPIRGKDSSVPSASSVVKTGPLPQKIAAAKAGSAKDAKDLLNLLRDVG